MAKKGRASKIEVFYIENNPDLSVSEIAKELDRTPAFVEKHRVVDTKTSTDTGIDTESEMNAGKLIGRKSRKGKFVAAIMTPGASEMSDEARKRGDFKKSRKTHDAIAQPYTDEQMRKRR